MHRFVRSKLVTVLLGALTLWLVVGAAVSGLRRYSTGSELRDLQVRIEDAKRENARIADELDRMHKPQWLALLARQRLNFKQPDETVVFVYKTEKAGTIAQPRTSGGGVEPRWRQWFDWVRGEKAGLPAEAP